MVNSNKLSATIITLNEEKDLPRCLESVKNLADEIIVVDSGSTDKTVDIAKEYGGKVYSREFDGMAGQKNYAAQKSTGEWILSVDADEEISSELAREIKSKIQNPKSKIIAYSMPRKNIIFGEFIKYTRWQPEFDRHIWLYKKDRGRFVGGVHAAVKVDGKVGRLKHAKVHYQYKNVKEFMDMMNSYSESESTERAEDGVKFSYFQLLLQPIYNFLVRYFYRLGFLDGWRGFVLSYLMAIYHFQLWVKVWEEGRG
jgi:glycosyltransferase involved in cell wall biosynthesis